MPSSNIARTHIRVRRSDGVEFPSMTFAYRQLLGTAQELSSSEAQRIRRGLRDSIAGRDSHGFTWDLVGDVPRFRGVEIARSTMAPVVFDAVGAAVQWNDLTFGVEIECMNSTADMYQTAELLTNNGFAAWRVVRDGSLNNGGREIVSPVLRGQAGLESLRRVMDLLRENGHTVDDRCGMHVHVGARDLSITQLKNVAHRFLSAEQHFDSIVPPSRRANRFCQSNTNRMTRSDWTTLRSARAVNTLARAMNGGLSPNHYNPYRYYKLNFQSYSLHGTMEFRQHSGTVESQKACAWARLILGFVSDSASHGLDADRAPMSWETFLGFAAESDRAFIQGRRDYFASRQTRRVA